MAIMGGDENGKVRSGGLDRAHVDSGRGSARAKGQ